jgi:hypothetical protein
VISGEAAEEEQQQVSVHGLQPAPVCALHLRLGLPRRGPPLLRLRSEPRAWPLRSNARARGGTWPDDDGGGGAVG